MAHAWTGGQYSVYRFALALCLAAHVENPAVPLLAIPFALGAADRWVALVLAFLVRGTGPVLPILLVAHALAPAKPYGSWAARGRPDPGGGWRLPAWHPFAWLGPGLVPPLRETAPATLFYDGACGLCHRAVRFVLAEDPDGRAFRFAPLASEAFERTLPVGERAALPDSIVVRTPDGRILVRAAALREVGARLGGFWRLLASASRVAPTALLDRGYDAIARVRVRLFARPADACPVAPAELRARFD